MELADLTIHPFKRVSPSRYTAIKKCLLCEAWTSSKNEPLLPPSPLMELGSVIHRLLEAAGRGRLQGDNEKSIETAWNEMILRVEAKMAQSPLRKHHVPLSKSTPDYEVRRMRACKRAKDIAHGANSKKYDRSKQKCGTPAFELWVESPDKCVGGYIDRVSITEDGVVLSDYKSGAVLEAGEREGEGGLKQAYKEQLWLYAALYQQHAGVWPVRLEVVPLQGFPIEVEYQPKLAEQALKRAKELLSTANQRIVEVQNGRADTINLASPNAFHCRFCKYRPACKAYWIAREKHPDEVWPADIKGFVRDVKYLRNGKIGIRAAKDNDPSTPCVTVRNLTDNPDRHPLLKQLYSGRQVGIYGLKYQYRSNDYVETKYTVIYSNQ